MLDDCGTADCHPELVNAAGASVPLAALVANGVAYAWRPAAIIPAGDYTLSEATWPGWSASHTVATYGRSPGFDRSSLSGTVWELRESGTFLAKPDPAWSILSAYVYPVHRRLSPRRDLINNCCGFAIYADVGYRKFAPRHGDLRLIEALYCGARHRVTPGRELLLVGPAPARVLGAPENPSRNDKQQEEPRNHPHRITSIMPLKAHVEPRCLSHRQSECGRWFRAPG